MPPIPKTKKIALLAKLLHRRFKGLPLPSERPVLEHMMYAALLENASSEGADAAYAVLENYFIDWNEIRVSTVRELADMFSMLPAPTAAGERIRRALQGVFEKTYMYDLEELRRKGKTLGQAVEFLREIPGCSRFMVDYTTQVALGGHLIPVDEASFRVFRLLGLTLVNKEGTQEDVPGLERAIPKKDGLKFFLQLHHFAASFFRTPNSVEFRTFLKPVDPEALKRDWTPPVLVVPRSAPKPTPKRPLPTVTLPFAPPDEDDFEEESSGTEAEFLPDESPYRPDDRGTLGRANTDASLPAIMKKKGKEKKKTLEPPKKPDVPITKPAAVASPSDRTESKLVKGGVKPSTTMKQPSKRAEDKKSDISIPIKKTEPKKESAKPKVSPKTQDSSTPTPVEKSFAPKPPNPLPTEKSTKSSTKQLREKKPK